MGVIFDTSFLIEAERRESEFSQFAENGKGDVSRGCSTRDRICPYRLRRADSTKRRLKRSAYVEKVIELFPIYYFEISIARIYAQLWSDLSRKGIQIGAHDLIIGSTALSLGFSVATYNLRHFEKIEGLKIENLILQR